MNVTLNCSKNSTSQHFKEILMYSTNTTTITLIYAFLLFENALFA